MKLRPHQTRILVHNGIKVSDDPTDRTCHLLSAGIGVYIPNTVRTLLCDDGDINPDSLEFTLTPSGSYRLKINNNKG